MGETMVNRSDPRGRYTVELWIRPLASSDGEQHEPLVDRLRRLEARGVVDEVSVHRWGRNIDLTDTHLDRPDDPDRAAWERVVEFLQWAVNNEVTLADFRETAAVGVGRMGREHPVVSLPRTALAVYQDGDLQWVFPFQRAGRRYTVSDWLEAATGSFDPADCGTVYESA
jgi:hypothetical protein